MLFLIFKLSIDNKKCHNAIKLYILIAILTLLKKYIFKVIYNI